MLAIIDDSQNTGERIPLLRVMVTCLQRGVKSGRRGVFPSGFDMPHTQ